VTGVGTVPTVWDIGFLRSARTLGSSLRGRRGTHRTKNGVAKTLPRTRQIRDFDGTFSACHKRPISERVLLRPSMLIGAQWRTSIDEADRRESDEARRKRSDPDSQVHVGTTSIVRRTLYTAVQKARKRLDPQRAKSMLDHIGSNCS
jgi:hypothetical protein